MVVSLPHESREVHMLCRALPASAWAVIQPCKAGASLQKGSGLAKGFTKGEIYYKMETSLQTGLGLTKGFQLYHTIVHFFG